MDLNLSNEQRELRSGLSDFLADTWTADRLRAASDAPGLSGKEWHEPAELGPFGLLVPEADGGLGLGWADAALLFEELGRALVPGPLTATLLAATLVPEALPGAVDGTTPVTAVDARDPYPVMEHPGPETQVVLVDDEGLFLLQSPPETSCAAHPLDPLTPVAPLDAARWRQAGALLTAALQVGVGGMGFTWEVVAHLYLKRAWLLETAYGVAGDHALELAESL